MRKIIALALLLTSLGAMGSVKEDLAGLYASAFRNNWKKVTAKTEALIENYEQNHDVSKVHQSLNELEKFVLMNNLNPEKTQSFLTEINATRKGIKKTFVSTRPAAKAMSDVVLVPLNKPQQSVDVYTGNFLKALAALSLLGFIFVIAWRSKSFFKRKRSFPFEKALAEEDLFVWKKIKPSFNIVSDVVTSPVVFSNERLLSLEFEVLKDLNRKSLAELQRIMIEQDAEMLLISEWNAANEFSRKLVFNFSKEGAA